MNQVSKFLIIITIIASGLLVTGFVVPYIRLHQDEYVEAKILEALNQEYDEINFSHVILNKVLNLETDSIPRYSWYAERTTSKYIRPFLASDQEIVWDNESDVGVNTIKGFIDLNGNVFLFGLNLW